MQTSNVTLVPASKGDESTLENLLHLYIHDFSEFLGLKPSKEGRFSYPALPLYWSEKGRAAFLVQSGESLVGFALVSQGSAVSGDPAVRDLAEFFVVRGARRRGVGQAAAHELFRLLPGRWEVRVAEFNLPAQQFWRSAIKRFAGNGFQAVAWNRDDGSRWNVFRFTSSSAPDPEVHAPGELDT